MNLFDIIKVLEQQFPPEYQEGYDNSGLQIRSGNDEISACLVTLDVTENVVDEAITKHCNLILSHHPVIFGKGLMRITGQNPAQRIVAKCLKNGISIYSAHTNVDAVKSGTSAVMAKRLGITNIEILLPATETDEHGSGAIGILDQPTPIMDFLRKVKDVFACGAIRYTEPIKPLVSKIAFCSGSGSFLLNEAIKHKADVFISSDFTYHKFFDTEKRILIADIGHYESEIGIKDVFSDVLTKNFNTFAVIISQENTNPIKYL